MSLNDPLANALSHILNSEKVAKKKIVIRPTNKIIENVLKLLQENNYVGSYEIIEDSKGNSLVLNLLGRINKCGAVKPRFPVKVTEFEKFEKRYLPAKNFGILVVSTPQGLMTHEDAKKKGIGGKLLAYCY
ncbi:30S ribosomal protein S8 [Candidatus Woesearchaeota archaeon]|nr:MAG: 30S ribosomal protein S8 [Candidatus Woesearchaeota archaeon]